MSTLQKIGRPVLATAAAGALVVGGAAVGHAAADRHGPGGQGAPPRADAQRDRVATGAGSTSSDLSSAGSGPVAGGGAAGAGGPAGASGLTAPQAGGGAPSGVSSGS